MKPIIHEMYADNEILKHVKKHSKLAVFTYLADVIDNPATFDMYFEQTVKPSNIKDHPHRVTSTLTTREVEPPPMSLTEINGISYGHLLSLAQFITGSDLTCEQIEQAIDEYKTVHRIV